MSSFEPVERSLL